jgi:imidazolonepropionase-like amidohydrolase
MLALTSSIRAPREWIHPMSHRRLLRLLSVLSLAGAVSLALAQRPSSLKPTVFAVRDARIVTEPGKILPKATVVLRDGLIEAVGADVKPPADALVIDGKGLTVYAGFLDGMSNWGLDAESRRSEAGPAAPEDLASEALATTKADNRKGVTPEFLSANALKADDEQADGWRRAGFTARLVAPDGGMIVGQSALVSLSGATPREAVLRSPAAQHIALRLTSGGDYPRSLMGVVAHARQTLLDAGPYHRQWQAFEAAGRVGRRPPLDPALEALGPALAGKEAVVFEADTNDAIHRALDFAAEFKLRPILYGGRDAWKAVDRLIETKTPVLLRLSYSEGLPRRPGRIAAGPPDPTAAEPDSARDLPKRVQDDRDRRLKREHRTAWELRQKDIPFAFSTQGLGDKPWDKFRDNLRKALDAGLPPDAALAALTIDAARILGVEKQLGTIAVGKAAHLVVMDGDFQEAETQVRHVFADAAHFEYEAKKDDKKEPKKPTEKKADDKEPKKPESTEVATEIEADREPLTRTSGRVLIKGATVLTCAEGDDKPRRVDILVRHGKIDKIGENLERPEGKYTVIDATGMFVMPGIIDTHCHFAVSGSVNEFSLSVVPEVRVRDVIDSEDVQIYRALAGGVTTARLLHGSANVVGGQDAVVKLKYGQPASKLLIADAPRGVKFALGENVKRTDGRFPNTRLGVEAVLVRAFTEAQEYRKKWDAFAAQRNEGKSVPEPRRDLRLEALADILRGDLKVHCHCYRSDEILMLLRVADRFGFKVRSLQHVLEGYKVAPEIAAHGASCSPFADWWAYKLEAYDAIPFNAALLHEAGVSVCLKSDSNELMRHLYQEAAKCVKYGGMSDSEALRTITLNGAKQLGLEKRIGSIEVGKDGDLAIFNGHPLNSYSRVEMALVEGEVYFQRSEKMTALAEAKRPPAKPVKEFKPIERSKIKSYVFVDATIHPADGKTPFRGSVIVADGKIVQTLRPSDPVIVPEGCVVVPCEGLHLYPGMIDAGTVIGLTELGSAKESHDFAEGGDFQPDLRASTAINPDSELIPVTRANGVTTVVTRPIGSVVAGQGALINLAGWTPREMTLVDPLALHVEFPTGLPVFSGDPNVPLAARAIARKQREEKLKRLRELFRQAAAYDEARKQSTDYPVNPRLEALAPYARGLKPVVVQANRKPEILEALKLADELKLKIIVSGGLDAWKVADELKKRDVPVIVGPVMSLPLEGYDPFDAPYACAAKLHAAGVRFCIRSGGGPNTRNLPYEAAMAAAYGLPPVEALKAVTLYPAQILGVADQVGSIEPSKRASLVLTNGDLLQASTQVLALMIDGRPLEPTSKHTRLYERYRERLKEVKDGQAPLGTK